MSMYHDVEKEGCRTSITEADHGDEAASSRSRKRSYSGDIRCESPGAVYNNDSRPNSIRSVRRDRSASRDREYNPSISSQHVRFSVDSRLERRRSFDSTTAGRRRSRESGHGPPGPIVTESYQMPLPRNVRHTLHLDRDDPGDWAVNHHLPNLIARLDEPELSSVGSKLNDLSTKLREIQYGRKSDPTPSSEDGMRFRISFAEVQRMRIRKLQCQLVRHVVKMRLNGSESPGWEQTLEQYIKALQDHDYMESRSKSIRDPFLATGEYGVDNYVLNCNIDSALAKDITKHVDSLRTWDVRPAGANDPITGTRGSNVAKTWYRGFKERIVIAAAGGAFLVGPMWIMVLKNGLYASLISTTAFVTAFGILMAYFLDEAKDVLASTAAYAAVLVVFVGTSNP
ncbi:hypothetical protein CGCSCA5_v005392 [Colletotrichum siamense]|nr:hypothetical protein CGCSCA5_v005392 [Colletotrichum siamense]